MADQKITALATGTTLHSDDWLVYVDTHDTSMASTGTDKKLSPAVLLAGLGITPGGSSGQIQYNSAGLFGGAAKLTVGSSGQLNLVAIAAPGSPADGDTWNDSGQACQARQAKGVIQYAGGLVYAQKAVVSATLAQSTTLVSTTGAVGTVALPTNFFTDVGQILRVRFGGYANTAGSAPGNIYFFAKLGTAVVATAASGNATFTSRVNVPFTGHLDIVCKATGVSGLLDCTGFYQGANASGGLFTFFAMIANGSVAGTMAPQTQSPIDTTAANTFDLQINLSATGNTFTLTNLTLENLG